jgi:glycolate oxidase subunit GlcD
MKSLVRPARMRRGEYLFFAARILSERMGSWIKQLSSIVGERNVLCHADQLLVYECDSLTIHKRQPGAVIFPTSADEVSRVLKVLWHNEIPFVARGAGTGLSGGAVAEDGAVIIELARMNRILRLDFENRLAVVEPGAVNLALSRAAAAEGFHYAPDPSSQTVCTIGGNVAENAGGPHCLKYGMTTNHVLGLEVVLPDGEIVNFGGGADAVGYNLTGLFVGSEGTFGIATKITVRLTRLPQEVRTMLTDFASLEDASRAVSQIIAAGIDPAALEMMDQATVRTLEESVFAAGLPTDAAAVLIIELDGLRASVEMDAARVAEICRANRARQLKIAADEREAARLWACRKGAFGAMARISPDLMVQDVVVPRSKLPEILLEIYRIAERYRLKIASAFHAGDGNLHPNIYFDRRDREQVERVKSAGREMMEVCVACGGTLTGEHGVGLDKIKFMTLVFNEDDLRAMALVRSVFDPKGLCNPKKVLPVRRCRAF